VFLYEITAWLWNGNNGPTSVRLLGTFYNKNNFLFDQRSAPLGYHCYYGVWIWGWSLERIDHPGAIYSMYNSLLDNWPYFQKSCVYALFFVQNYRPFCGSINCIIIEFCYEVFNKFERLRVIARRYRYYGNK